MIPHTPIHTHTPKQKKTGTSAASTKLQEKLENETPKDLIFAKLNSVVFYLFARFVVAIVVVVVAFAA